MITKENIEYKRWRNEIKFQKFPEYIEHLHNKFGHNYKKMDLHHLLGSERALKHTDALVFPFEHNFHLYVVEKNKSYYFNKYLRQSMQLFNDWIVEKFRIDGYSLENVNPKEYNEWLNEIKKLLGKEK